MFKRSQYPVLQQRLREPRRFIQILSGPRQVGKTTLIRQVMNETDRPIHYASADLPALQTESWIRQQWETARTVARQSEAGGILVLDEVQKLPLWAETVKGLWDADTFESLPLHVVLSGSSPLLIPKGLTESLAGRFEIIPMPHWGFAEMEAAFDLSLEQYLYYGGYPGAIPLIHDPERWRAYINDSLIETSISRDILLMSRIDKPALLRQLFYLACAYSGQILSYQKIVGQLHEAGNTTTLAHYLHLLGAVGLVTGLQKFSGQKIRQRASSPKFQVLNTALITAQIQQPFEQAIKDGIFLGRLMESAVGAHLLNSSLNTGINVLYWREQNREVDFVLEYRKELVAIEVKSGTDRNQVLPGMEKFTADFRPKKSVLVGQGGISLEQFLRIPARDLLR